MRALLVAAVALAGCVGTLEDDLQAAAPVAAEPLVPEPRLSEIQRLVFTPRCAGTLCHDHEAPAEGLDLSEGHSHIALHHEHEHAEEEEHEEGHEGYLDGFLIRKLRGELAEGEGDPMPLGGTPLPEPTIQAIQDWIDAGALDD